MAIDVTCTCGKRFSVPEEHAGKKGRCPACGKVITVPSISTDDLDRIASESGLHNVLMEELEPPQLKPRIRPRGGVSRSRPPGRGAASTAPRRRGLEPRGRRSGPPPRRTGVRPSRSAPARRDTRGPSRYRDDDREERFSRYGARRKQSSNTPLIIGVAIGGAALVIILIVVLMSGGTPSGLEGRAAEFARLMEQMNVKAAFDFNEPGIADRSESDALSQQFAPVRNLILQAGVRLSIDYTIISQSGKRGVVEFQINATGPGGSNSKTKTVDWVYVDGDWYVDIPGHGAGN